MNQRQKGFILLPVLFLWQILSVICLHDLFTNFIWHKNRVNAWSQHLNNNVVHEILQKIEVEMTEHIPLCTIDLHAPSWVIRQPMSWWRQISCSGILAQIRYYYVIELWDLDPCGIVQSEDNKTLVASYYRITLFALMNAPKGAKIFRQSIFVKGGQNAMQCLSRFHDVLPGWQLNRKLNLGI